MKKRLEAALLGIADAIMAMVENEIEERVKVDVDRRMKAVHAAFLGKTAEDEPALREAHPKNVATREKVRELVMSGKSRRDAAVAVGVSSATANGWCKDLPVESRGGGGSAGRGVDKKRKAAIIVEASKPGATLSRIEKREGLSRGLLSKWGVKKQRVPATPKTTAPKRRDYDDKFKRDIVLMANGMAPGDRETFLVSEGIHKTLYYRWKKWAAKSPV